MPTKFLTFEALMGRKISVMRRGLATLLALVLLAGSALTNKVVHAADPRPNLIVFMTDDQTVEAMRFLPKTRHHIEKVGVSFTNSFVAHPLCCPSRATFLSGKYPHNHGVAINVDGYQKFGDQAELPKRLQAAGYRTIHVGKYLNGYGESDPTEIPNSWTSWNGLADPTTYAMWGYTMNRNGVVKTHGSLTGKEPAFQYQTDFLTKVAKQEIAASNGGPFFLSMSYLAPHGEKALGQKRDYRRNPRPAPRHKDALANIKAPRPPSFGIKSSDKPDLVDRTSWSASTVVRIDALYRARARSLLAVDDSIDAIMRQLNSLKLLSNTLIAFTSDNGFFLGEYQLPYGKFYPYEPGIRVPLIFRGPGIARGQRSDFEAVNIDLAPTLLSAAGIGAGDLDGESLRPYLADPQQPSPPRSFLIATYTAGDDLTNIIDHLDLETGEARLYRSVRTERYKYIEWAKGGAELYDLQADPHELSNVVADSRYASVRLFMQSKLGRLASCSALACRLESRDPPPVVG